MTDDMMVGQELETTVELTEGARSVSQLNEERMLEQAKKEQQR